MTQCLENQCNKEARPDRAFCETHARTFIPDRESVAQSTKLEKTAAKYGFSQPGVASPQSSAYGREESSDMPMLVKTQKSENETQREGESTMRTERLNIVNDEESSTRPNTIGSEGKSPKHGWSDKEETEKLNANEPENGMQRTEPSTSLTKSVGATPEILPRESSRSLLDLKEELSASMKLIDDSTRHLFDLMKSIGADQPQNPEIRKLADPQQINSACNCAKQIYGLLRLKFDVAKEVSKRSGE